MKCNSPTRTATRARRKGSAARTEPARAPIRQGHGSEVQFRSQPYSYIQVFTKPSQGAHCSLSLWGMWHLISHRTSTRWFRDSHTHTEPLTPHTVPLTLTPCLSHPPSCVSHSHRASHTHTVPSHTHIVLLTPTSCVSHSHRASHTHTVPLTLTTPCLSHSHHASHTHTVPLIPTPCLSHPHRVSHTHTVPLKLTSHTSPLTPLCAQAPRRQDHVM